MREKKDISWRRGSLTIEAVFIVGMFLWILFVLLALIFYVHERSFYTAVACEKAQKESNRLLWQSRELQEVKKEAQELAKERRVPAIIPQFFWESQKTQIKLCYQGEVTVAFGDELLHYESQAISRICCPVEKIRKMRRLQQLAKTAGGKEHGSKL